MEKLCLAAGNLASLEYKSYVDRLELKGSEHVIELGPGAGNVTHHLAAGLNQGGWVTAVEISETWLQVARKRLRSFSNVTLLHGDGTRLDLPESSQDAIVLSFVLHEIPASQRQRVMSCLIQKLRAGGQMFVREPLRFISQPEIRELMERNGFQETCSTVRQVATQGQVLEATFRRQIA